LKEIQAVVVAAVAAATEPPTLFATSKITLLFPKRGLY
jgi:hypothetical protein